MFKELAEKLASECQTLQNDYLRYERAPDMNESRLRGSILSIYDTIMKAKKEFPEWNWDEE